jgi:AcrR family transcriptional regulator
LLLAARRVVRDDGLSGATSRQITATAGTNLAAITYHFGSKDELVADALLAELRAWLAPATDILRGDGDPATRTMLAIQALVATFERHKASAPTYLQAMAHAALRPSLRTPLVELWDELRTLLAVDIATMQEAGQLPAWVEPAAMAAVLMAVANGLVLQVTIDTHSPDLATLAGQFGALLLAARPAA